MFRYKLSPVCTSFSYISHYNIFYIFVRTHTHTHTHTHNTQRGKQWNGNQPSRPCDNSNTGIPVRYKPLSRMINAWKNAGMPLELTWHKSHDKSELYVGSGPTCAALTYNKGSGPRTGREQPHCYSYTKIYHVSLMQKPLTLNMFPRCWAQSTDGLWYTLWINEVCLILQKRKWKKMLGGWDVHKYIYMVLLLRITIAHLTRT